MLELVVGSTPRGVDYFGREDLIESLWERLRKDNVLLAAHTPPEARAAKAILGTLSRSEKPVDRETLYQLYLKTTGQTAGEEQSEAFLQLMNKLENDFYVVAKEGRFLFYSRVLAAWWKARYGFFVE